MTDLSLAQIKEIRSAVLGAAAKVPSVLIGMIGVAGKTMFSFVTVNVLGAFLIFGGAVQFARALKSIDWKGVAIMVMFALLYIVAGAYTWAFPIPALEAIKLWLAAIFFIAGFLRLISAFERRHFNEWI